MLTSVKSMALVRIATPDKVIKSKLLNLLGIQVLRILTARLLYHLRPFSVPQNVKAKVDDLRREGILVWPNFMPPDDFEAIRRECLQLLEENGDRLEVRRVGPNTDELFLFGDSDFEKGGPASSRGFFADSRLTAILEASEKEPLSARGRTRAVQRLTQGPFGAEEDAETELHSDIFFSTHKAWLYLDDVGPDDGPFVYVKRSHRLTATQLFYAYQESCSGNQGSRRIQHAELEGQGLEETIVTCPKNTLVVADTNGYHRRLRGLPGRRRHGLHTCLRGDPFLWWVRSESGRAEADY